MAGVVCLGRAPVDEQSPIRDGAMDVVRVELDGA